jgi:hypothetical protein
MIKIYFSYTDECGESTTIIKNCSDTILSEYSEFEFLIDEFKEFLFAHGFAQETVDKLQIVEDHYES